ncbi:hypothetical protein P7C70_g4376, partial [Phenoliferia sp. Uapishka_3]
MTADATASPHELLDEGVIQPSYASSDTAPVTKQESMEDKEFAGSQGGQLQQTLSDQKASPSLDPLDPESKYLSGKKLALVFVGMLLSVFLIALDQTILAPALPVIASKFQALDQLAWIASTAAYTERKFARWTFGKWCPPRNSIAFRLGVLDWIGTVLILATITLLLLPLQWGGNKYAWTSGVVIGTFVAFGVLVVLFTVYEWKFAGKSSILPLRFFRNRTQVGACLEAFFLMFVLLLGTYYLPILFQATRGVSATKSGIDILPFMLGVVFAAGAGGGAVSYFGRYQPILFAAPALICVGSGLLYTITEHTPMKTLIGFQIILGIGVGLVMQNTIIAVQADIEDQNDVSQATGLVTFAQLVGGTIGISIASTVFGSKLSDGLREFAPLADFDLVRNSVQAIKNIPIEQQAGVIHAYVKALNVTYIIGVGAGVCASLSALLIRNISVKGKDLMAGGV